jgi:hypothetical protein
MNVDKYVRQLVKKETAIAKRDRRLSELAEDQERDRVEAAQGREQLALAVLGKRGLLDLPTAQLMEKLSNLDAVAIAGEGLGGAIISAPLPAQTVKPVGEPASATSEKIDVTVRISGNAAEAKRTLLSDAGLRWNGKAGRWIGAVDRYRIEELRAVFGDRVAIKLPEGAVAPSGILPAVVEPATDPAAEASPRIVAQANHAGSETGPAVTTNAETGEAV